MDGFTATFKYQGPSNLQKSRRSRVEHGMTSYEVPCRARDDKGCEVSYRVQVDEAQEEVHEL